MLWAFSLAFLLRALLWRFQMSIWLIPSLLGFIAFPWEYLLGPVLDVDLCVLTASYAEPVARWSGLKTFINMESSNIIMGEGYNLRVTPSCAGIQTFVALQTLSLVLAEILYSKNAIQALRFLGFVLVGGFIGNTIRIILSCHCAYWFAHNMTYWNISHHILGILTYVVVLSCAFYLQKLWSNSFDIKTHPDGP